MPLQQPGLARGPVPQAQPLQGAPFGRVAGRAGRPGECGVQDEHPAEGEQPRPEPPPAQPPPGLAGAVTLLLRALLPLPLLLPSLLRALHPAVAACGLRDGPAVVRLLAAGAARPFRAGLRHHFGPRVRCHVRPSSSATRKPANPQTRDPPSRIPQPTPAVPSPLCVSPGRTGAAAGPGTRRCARAYRRGRTAPGRPDPPSVPQAMGYLPVPRAPSPPTGP